MSDSPVLIWFRRDLRLSDNPALMAGVETGRPLILLYIDETNAARPDGGAKRVWLHHSLLSLTQTIEEKGGKLTLRRGPAEQILDEIIEQTGAETVFWNRRYEADGIERDSQIKASLKDRGLSVKTFNGPLLTEPWEVRQNRAGIIIKSSRLIGAPPRKWSAPELRQTRLLELLKP